MNVKKLIELLQKEDQEAEVILAKDEEGNNYSPLVLPFNNNAIYVPQSPWNGDIYLLHLTPELEKQGYSEEDDVYHQETGDKSIKSLVLYPAN